MDGKACGILATWIPAIIGLPLAIKRPLAKRTPFSSYPPIKGVYQHRNGLVDDLTKRYKVHDLVWYEPHVRMESAISREKQIKGWSSAAKIDLIEKHNPEWSDLWLNLTSLSL